MYTLQYFKQISYFHLILALWLGFCKESCFQIGLIFNMGYLIFDWKQQCLCLFTILKMSASFKTLLQEFNFTQLREGEVTVKLLAVLQCFL